MPNASSSATGNQKRALNKGQPSLGPKKWTETRVATQTLTVREAQIYLTYLGLHPGPVDGSMGRLTRSAISQFQAQSGLGETGNLDDATQKKLRGAAGQATESLQTTGAAAGGGDN